LDLQGQTLPHRGEVIRWGETLCLLLRSSKKPGVNTGVNIPTRGQSSPLGAKFTPSIPLGTLWAHQTEENPICALGNDYYYKDTINQMINIPAECKPENVRMISCSVLQIKINRRHLLNDDNPVVELLPLQDGVEVMQESMQMGRTIPEIFGSKKFSCGQLFVHFFRGK
jgi:hypothetical protein